MFRKSTKSSVPLGGNCSAELGQNCAPGLQCVRFGAAGNAPGKCMLPPGSVSPGKKPTPSGPTPSPPLPGTMGGACRTASNLTQCIEDPKVGPLVCQAGKCVPVGIMPGPVRPTPSGPGPSPSGPTPGKKPAPGAAPGEGQSCIPPQYFPGSGLRGNCQPGLVCKSSSPDVMPICMKPTKSGMGSKEILTIIGLIFLGLCFLCGLAKMGMKDAKRKSNCDKACGAFVFLGVTLIAVSSVLKSSN